MGIDLSRGHMAVAQKFLNRADVVVGFEEMGGEGVAQRVAGGELGDARGSQCRFHRSLDEMLALSFQPRVADEAGYPR
jgi:hypothetical protein